MKFMHMTQLNVPMTNTNPFMSQNKASFRKKTDRHQSLERKGSITCGKQYNDKTLIREKKKIHSYKCLKFLQAYICTSVARNLIKVNLVQHEHLKSQDE